jgi:hypothetical protein
LAGEASHGFFAAFQTAEMPPPLAVQVKPKGRGSQSGARPSAGTPGGSDAPIIQGVGSCPRVGRLGQPASGGSGPLGSRLISGIGRRRAHAGLRASAGGLAPDRIRAEIDLATPGQHPATPNTNPPGKLVVWPGGEDPRAPCATDSVSLELLSPKE